MRLVVLSLLDSVPTSTPDLVRDTYTNLPFLQSRNRLLDLGAHLTGQLSNCKYVVNKSGEAQQKPMNGFQARGGSQLTSVAVAQSVARACGATSETSGKRRPEGIGDWTKSPQGPTRELPRQQLFTTSPLHICPFIYQPPYRHQSFLLFAPTDNPYIPTLT